MDTKRKTYRIVDFGFSSQEPFQDFIKKPKGTPGYLPYYFEKTLVTEYFPKVKANDFIVSRVTSKIPCRENYMLVYQIDSYCLGRTFYALWKIFLQRYQLGLCIFPSYRKNINAIQKVDLILVIYLSMMYTSDLVSLMSIIDSGRIKKLLKFKKINILNIYKIYKMLNDPLIHLLHSLIVGLLLYIVFKYIMLFKEHSARVSAMVIGAVFLLYLILFYEIKDIVKGRSNLLKN